MAKRALMFLLFSLFLITSVSAALKIEKTPVQDSIVKELGNQVIFDFKITNQGQSDFFQIYSLVGIDFQPAEKFYIESGQTKELQLKLIPTEAVLNNPGIFNFVYKIKGDVVGIQEDTLAIKIANLKTAFEINSYTIVLDSGEVIVYFKNLVDINFSEIKASFHSAFFDFDKTFSLNKYSTVEFNVPLNKETAKMLVAGSYVLTTDLELLGLKEQIESTFRYAEKADVTTKDSSSGIIFRKRVVEKTNSGNIPFIVKVEVRKNILSRLFTNFNIEPTKTERKSFFMHYTFQKELRPSETLTVKVMTSWFYPLIIILFLILIGYLVNMYYSGYLTLTKKTNFVKTKGGEFALKVSVHVKAKKFVEKITIIDKIPGLVKIYDKFPLAPNRIDEKNKRLEWDLDSLQPGEERVFSYIIYSKIGIVGKFELPAPVAVYTKDNKSLETEGNRVYFLSDRKIQREEL